MADVKILIDQLYKTHTLSKEEWIQVLEGRNEDVAEYLFAYAREIALKNFDHKIYIRGLIEFTNYCRNDCYYCGIRKSNEKAERYRLSQKDILECCKAGYELGFRTFVLQGGEDGGIGVEKLAEIVRQIKNHFPDCAVTLSFGEWSRAAYATWREAGADRYLLRHETATEGHYHKLHPETLSLKNRMRCLNDLKDLGYQVGCGFMVDSPYQTVETLAEDFMYIGRFQPEMIGVGPFIPHEDTPFRNMCFGNMPGQEVSATRLSSLPEGALPLTSMPGNALEKTIYCIGLLRLLCPHALIPATTALGTIAPKGRELGVMAGANVIMPNLSPENVRDKYTLYNNKIHSGAEAAQNKAMLEDRMKAIGYEIVEDRGDFNSLNRLSM